MNKSTTQTTWHKVHAGTATYHAGVAQNTTYRYLNQLFSELLQPYELSCMQWFMIGKIYDAGPNGISITDLAQQLATGLPFVTNSVNLLSAKGIVKRMESELDARTKLVAIEDASVQTIEHIEKELRSKIRNSIYKSIDPDDLKVYIKVLYQIEEIGKQNATSAKH